MSILATAKVIRINVQMRGTMKACPFCAEEIQADAVKCKHCKEWLSNPGENNQQPGDIPTTDKRSDLTTAPDNRNTNGSVLDSSSLTKWLKIFLYAAIVIDLIAVFSGILQIQLLTDFKQGVYTSVSLTTAAAEANDQRQQIVGIFQGCIYLIFSVLFFSWIHRANYNVRQLGAKNMKFTPGWSIGWYFIPIAFFWKPYQAMKEIWKASKKPDNWESQSVSPILPWWWFFFIINVFLGRIVFKSVMRAKELDDLIGASVGSIALDMFSIPWTILTIVLVSRIYEMQIAQKYMPAQQFDIVRPQEMSSISAIKDSETLFARHNRGLLALIISVPLIGIIAAIAIPAFMGTQERARKAKNEQASAPTQSAGKLPEGFVLDEVKSAPAPPAPVHLPQTSQSRIPWEDYRPIEDASSQFLDKFARLVPDWQTIKDDPKFLEWLHQTDTNSRKTRYDQLSEAQALNNSESVASIYIRYRNEAKITMQKEGIRKSQAGSTGNKVNEKSSPPAPTRQPQTTSSSGQEQVSYSPQIYPDNSIRGKTNNQTTPEKKLIDENSPMELRFDANEKTITDFATSLEWTKDANIFISEYRWDESQYSIEKLNRENYAGHNDWRMPTRWELKILSKYSEKLGQHVMSGAYWSSTQTSDHQAWAVSMRDGGAASHLKSGQHYIWPVRSH